MASKEPETPKHSPHDDDPTGVQRLLSTLPDPAPMPRDLVDRINASLREESQRAEDVHYALFAGRGTKSISRRCWRALGTATAVLAAGVMAATSLQQPESALSRALTGPGPTDEGTPSLSTEVGESPDHGANPHESHDSSAVMAHGQSGINPPSSPQRQGLTMWGESPHTYVPAELLPKAKQLLSSASTAHLGPVTSKSGRLSTLTGLERCLQALDIPSDASVVVDVATYEGKPVAVVASQHEGVEQVRVVRRSCTEGDPGLIAGPYGL
ncbi:hypothetical protein KEM60_00345 [Austwickia sp. TVS 96-490-7B]|uniref:hypothetical protein n=1 Tax=Austwickia sp. TVS 96-490-7B TaxID=2830843 RepID=UPI001C59AA0A|nr:hypothetical protein [Austwickia sp. TVS 96-490-7B]MBW3084161.1 hypothetical protein [Austwickia sp. TVS 96-490-7B]